MSNTDGMVVGGTAGCGAGIRQDGSDPVPYLEHVNGDMLLHITGDSMPPFSPGDYVTVAFREARVGNRVIVTIDGDSLCKKLSEVFEEDGEVKYRFTSANGDFEELVARADDVTIHGVVVGWTKTWRDE